ncbi:MAG: DUF3791 domain-containing protein [Muribaculaceae bacterium]|nr:DUF3791 domain-containing protein [Muribaculaceae bacterium]MDE6787138.1 DUF3791 domain-containing protein [Muribaculaceae bacterium]
MESKQNTLGTIIRLERKKAGLTQAQLGERIGLKESRVSKIENGAPITPEVASYILGKIGSELQIKAIVKKPIDRNSIDFLIGVVHNFSKIKGISLGRAFKYLKTFKGLEYLREYQEIEQTLSYEDITSDLLRVCMNNGGAL